MPMIEEFFRSPLLARWRCIRVGNGHLVITNDGLRLLAGPTHRNHYTNAQFDDYAGLPRWQYPWRPPLRLTVRARASANLVGTAGFGFWNHPFSPQGEWPALPAAIWFFYASSPSHMPLALDGPACGWKVACIDATRPAALSLIPLALPVTLLNQWQPLYRRIWPAIQRRLRIGEASFAGVNPAWHTYTLEWRQDYARFAMDDQTILETEYAPRGSLGFVAWVDTQWMRVTPQGRLGWGLLEVNGWQWIDLASVRIELL